MKNLKITVNGTIYDVQVEEVGENASAAQPAASAPKAAPAPTAAPAPAGGEAVCAPMPGTIVKINVAQGDSVQKGDQLFVLEAMKMENEIISPRDGTVAAVHCNKGDSVESGKAVVTLQ